MFLVSVAEMRECDRKTIEEHGVPGPVLMERAGQGIALSIKRRFGSLNRRKVWIVCGRGNNGGDGLVLARLLHDDGYNPRVLLTDPADAIGGDAALQIGPLLERGLPLEIITDETLAEFDRLSESDLLVDAILGTGFKGTLKGKKKSIVDAMNDSEARVVAVDIPSGLQADKGEVAGTAIEAELTVTMAYPKRAFLVWPARDHVGDWDVVDIGVPESVESEVAPVARLLTPEIVADKIPPFPRDAHKGTKGKLVIAGGSPGLSGAPILAASGAQHAGAGLIRVAVPESLNPVFESQITEATSVPVAETDAGTLDPMLRDLILGWAKEWDALVLGPGLGRHPETDRLAHDLYSKWPGPIIVDADGLNALAALGLPKLRRKRPHPVLTPHPGEMARLTGGSLRDIKADPIGTALEFAREHKVVLVLKGAPTVIAEPAGKTLVNTSGNPGLGTGGSGDVLSGMVGAFLAQGIEPWWAAGAAVFLHGLAADRLAEGLGERSVLPTDVAEVIPEAWAEVDEARDG